MMRQLSCGGGKSFEVLSEGLRRRPAYDLCSRHALEIDRSGDAFVFGGTTGNLWITENEAASGLA